MSSPKGKSRYPLCFKCGDAVDMAYASAKVVCEECAVLLEGKRDGGVLIVELESEHEMGAEDPSTWN